MIRAALDDGVTLLDTGDFYGMGHNEWLIRQALRDGDRDRIALSVKFGMLRDFSGAMVGVDARPAAVKKFLAYSLQRLGTDHVDIYRRARLDRVDSRPGHEQEELYDQTNLFGYAANQLVRSVLLPSTCRLMLASVCSIPARIPGPSARSVCNVTRTVAESSPLSAICNSPW